MSALGALADLGLVYRMHKNAYMQIDCEVTDSHPEPALHATKANYVMPFLLQKRFLMNLITACSVEERNSVSFGEGHCGDFCEGQGKAVGLASHLFRSSPGLGRIFEWQTLG